MATISSTPVADGPVCVTGATGYIALHVVRLLLERGYDVRATVRSTDSARAKTLRSLCPDGSKLTLHVCDLLNDGSFDEAVSGCTAVIHTASPFYVEGIKDAEAELLRPAVKGTENVLRACLSAKTVRRVVVTSSFAAVWHDAAKGHVYTEKDWNTHSKVDMDGINQYRLSKVSAERAAWAFVEANGGDACPFQVATVNPPLVIGESIHAETSREALNTSSRIILDWASGKREEVPPGGGGYVDVRDVAAAHVAAMEHMDAGVSRGQRYLVASCALSHADLVEAIRSVCPEAKLPAAPGTPLEGVAFGLDGSKATRDLGIKYATIEEMLGRQIASLKDMGLLQL